MLLADEIFIRKLRFVWKSPAPFGFNAIVKYVSCTSYCLLMQNNIMRTQTLLVLISISHKKYIRYSLRILSIEIVFHEPSYSLQYFQYRFCLIFGFCFNLLEWNVSNKNEMTELLEKSRQWWQNPWKELVRFMSAWSAQKRQISQIEFYQRELTKNSYQLYFVNLSQKWNFLDQFFFKYLFTFSSRSPAPGEIYLQLE